MAKRGSSHVQVSANKKKGPVLGFFGGNPTPPSNAHFAVYKNESQNILAHEGTKMVWHSVPESAHGSEKYMLGVLDKQNNRLIIYPTESKHFESTSIAAIELDRKDDAAIAASQDESREKLLTASRTFTQDKMSLGSEFGTRKAVRDLRAQEKNKVTVDSYGEGRVDSILEGISASTADDAASAVQHPANEIKPAPDANTDASSPENVYPLEILATEATLRGILPNPDEWLSSDYSTQLPYRRSAYVNSRLGVLASLEGTLASRARLQARLLVYMAYLLAFRALGERMLVSGGSRRGEMNSPRITEALTAKHPADKSVVAEPPPFLVNLLAEKYMQRSQVKDAAPQFTKVGSMRLLVDILLLALHIDNFKTDIHDLGEDLALDPKKIRDSYRALGCSTSETKTDGAVSRVAVLKLPLQFPKPRRGR